MHALSLPRGRWIPTDGSRSRVRSAAGIHAQTTPPAFPQWFQQTEVRRSPQSTGKPQIPVLSREQLWGNEAMKWMHKMCG